MNEGRINYLQLQKHHLEFVYKFYGLKKIKIYN